MAAISISQSPKELSSMSTKRVPLGSNTNVANSLFRPTVGAASKQKRSYANVQHEEAYGQPPPAKKQMLESSQSLKTPPRQQSAQSSAEGRVLFRKAIPSQHNPLERKGVAVRERPQQTVVRAEKVTGENLEGIKAWQKHYRKVFPTCVFYFESVPDDIRIKCTRKVLALGAKEEKFFSNAVTHVITTRSIPAERVAEVPATSSTNDTSQHSSKTINPSLLDRSSETTNTQSESGGKKFTFEAPGAKRLVYNDHDGELKRPQVSNDVLTKARALGMKIWALEKLQRMVTTMFDTDTGYQAAHGHNTRSNSVQGSATASRTARDADIQQLLRNERINGPSDRDPTVTTKELTMFKGPYLYVQCHFGKHRPMMVREYTKVAHKEDGDWPQFRSVANGKCPFVEEVDNSRREAEKEREMIRLQKEKEREKLMIPRTRSAAAVEARMQPPKPVIGKRALSEVELDSARNVTVSAKQANPFAPVKSSLSAQTEQISSSQRGAQNAFVSRAAGARLFAGEPVASGIQPSNITSAIRSTMASSTAAQPGAKAGTSKEVASLQRKLLEKNSGGPGSFGPSSHRMTDISVATREESVSRTLKRRGQDKLGLIEEADHSEGDENVRRVEPVRKSKVVQRKEKKRDPKPGYCENCQEKFEDFEEHVVSRKHRKFAEKLENWKDLDSLLQQLARPLREQLSDEDY